MTSLVGLFAGIGGIELGLRSAGHHTELLCELDPAARGVLQRAFPGVPLHDDVRTLKAIPAADVLAAGFPCQDLSQAGLKTGISGLQSSLISHVFRLCRSKASRPRWLVLENVSYMLKLDRGRAMFQITSALESFGYRWAYRVVDARSFGVPQRRQRVLLVASRTEDPCEVLFADDSSAADLVDPIDVVPVTGAHGFYWTEGTRGLGWAINAVPTIKGGSKLGIPSAPAVWYPAEDFVGTPALQDCERLQGFPADWTAQVDAAERSRGARWRLVGNAVCVPMAKWLGARLAAPGAFVADTFSLASNAPWPNAAFGSRGMRIGVHASVCPLGITRVPLAKFLEYELKPLSVKATSGFLSRARAGSLRFPVGLLESLDKHLSEQLAREGPGVAA